MMMSSRQLLLWYWSTLLLQTFLLTVTNGYYQQPQAVQFTTAPRDTVVCQGCTLNLTCSVLRQPTPAGEKFVPLPELEWIFDNGTRISEVHSEVRVQTRDSLTHRTSELIITDARAHHGGVYRCRALDGNNADNCSRPSVQCVPVATISRPARIQIVESSDESEVVSSCSDVVLLACGSKLLEGDSVERPTLTWKRNGEELSVDSYSESMLSSGDLVISNGPASHDLDSESHDSSHDLNSEHHHSSHDTPLMYECVASFNDSRQQRNITLERYTVPRRSTVTEDTLRVTSSAVRVVEGGSVELVCEASLRGGDGVCLSYNVTWVTNGSRLVSDGGRDTLTADSETSLDVDGHVLRISQVSNTSVYCCLVHTGGTVVEECTTVHVVRENVPRVDARTVFLGGGGGGRGVPLVTKINCFPSSPAPHNLTWYHNAQLIENFTSSSLTVSRERSSDVDVFGVYQCFCSVGQHYMEEISLVRVLPYGLTNPPSSPTLREIPYPPPDKADIRSKAAYRVSWDPPLFTGGLAPPLHYEVAVYTPFTGEELVSMSDSVVAYILVGVDVAVYLSVYDSTGNVSVSEEYTYEHEDLESDCRYKVYYPPKPTIDCGHGQINLSYVLDQTNNGIEGTEDVYMIGNCTYPNGSLHQFGAQDDFTNPHVFSEAVFAVGSLCQFSMASAKRMQGHCNSDCFCFDPAKVLHSDITECTVQGSVEFVSTRYQVLENESSVDVCVLTRGYGFSVNVSTVELTAAAGYNFLPLIDHQWYVDNSNGGVDHTLCFSVSLVDNDVIEAEREKYFTVVLDVDSQLVAVGNDHTLVEIIDNDYTNAAVYFNQSSYSVNESSAGLLQVCVGLTGRPEVDVVVMVTSDDITARAGNDYAAVNITLVFSLDKDLIQCFDVAAYEDSVYESSEEFSLSLSCEGDFIAMPDNQIIIITILDGDYATLQFTQSSYTISEGDEPLEVCVTVVEEIEIPVSVVVLSHDLSAEAGEDYITVNDSLLFTPGGNSAHCFDVVVLDDSISESVETFTLSLVAMDDEETTHVDTVTVTILDGEFPHPAAEENSVVIVGVSVGVAFFLVILAVAGGVSCLVTVLLKRKLKRPEKKPNEEFETKDDFDFDFEPPILIGENTFTRRHTKADEFDSRTLLDYLLAQELLAAEHSNKLTSTSADPTQAKDVEYGAVHLHPTAVGYHVSVESGVVVDCSDPMIGRKISDGSYNVSQGSHSYIGVSRSITCSCNDCKLQRGQNTNSGRVSTVES